MDYSAYIEKVSACEDSQSLKKLLINTFDEYGARAISGYRYPFFGVSAGDRSPIIVSNFPEQVREAYRELMADDDPVMQAAMAVGTPVHFLKIEKSLRISKHSELVLNMMRASGFKDGVAAPVFDGPGAHAYFVAAFSTPKPDLTAADLRRICFLFSEFFHRLRQISDARGKRLSAREREVMVGIVNDWSSAEIAAKMGVSTHSVDTYIRRCFAKLEVNSRMQAALRFLGAEPVASRASEPHQSSSVVS